MSFVEPSLHFFFCHKNIARVNGAYTSQIKIVKWKLLHKIETARVDGAFV